MALKKWHRAGLVAGGMVLAVVVMLPSRPLPEPGDSLYGLFRSDIGPWGWARYDYTLSRTLDDLRNRHRAAVMADSLLALTRGPRAVRSANSALTVLYERPLSAESARVWLGMFERELALAPRGSGLGIPIVVALRSAPATSRRADAPDEQVLAHDGAARPFPWVAMRFLSPRGERPTCFAALRLVPARANESFSPSELIERDHRTGIARTAALDWCLIYARFGVPGARVDRWTGHRVELRRWWAPGDNLSWALESARHGRTTTDMIPTASPQELEAYWADPLNSACVRGSRVPCLKSVGLITDPTLRSESFWMGRVRRSLLAALMLKDPVRFEKFWRSNERADVALEQAYGRPASDLIAEWKRSVFSVPATGPRAAAGAFLSSLGWAAGVMAIGLVLAMRRQVSS